jgi:hypothetical protein
MQVSAVASSQNKGYCKCLKSIDQTGVPVTLNWQGENTHSTRCGGLVSILGIWLVLAFIVGSLVTFTSFNQFN